MAFTEDLTPFFDTDDFGVAATIGAATVNGIFDNQFLGAPGEAPIAGTTPTFTCRAADVSAVVSGTSTAVINSVTYTVVGIHPDGTGVTTLILRR